MKGINCSTKKFGHISPWPAFTETIDQDSVTKREDCPGALKVRSEH